MAWPILIVGVAAPAIAAATGTQHDGVEWLMKMASASRQVNYSGTFVYNHAGRT
jgi:negative regulator of sigma E activity